MKKLVSIFLTFIMILSVFSIIPMSANAQTIDPDKVYVKTGGQYYEAQKGQIFTYQHLISVDSTKKVSGFDVNVYYDTEGLDFVPYIDEYGDEDASRHFPNVSNGLVHNFAIDGEIIYTFSNYRGVLFDNNSVLFTGQFEVTASSGVYEIDSKIKNLADTDLCVIVYQGEKYDEYEESESITDLSVAEGITDAPTEPEKEKLTVYFVDSVNAHTSRKDAPLFAHAVKGVAGSEDYIENAPLPGQYLAKVALSSPDGALVRKVFIDECFDTISFGYSNSYPQKPSTPYVEIKDGWFFDNGTNQWYEKLEDIPAYVPTETPTVNVTEKPVVRPTEKPVVTPTLKPTEKPENKYEGIDGLYVVADGVFYKAEKGQKFTYQYCVSVDDSRRVAGFVTQMYYDTEGLDFVPYYDEYGDFDAVRHFPEFLGGMVYNFNIDGEILYNYSSLNGVKLHNNSVVFTGEFEVTADSGVYELNTVTTSMCDTDVFVIVYQSEKYDEFEDAEIITNLTVSEDIAPMTEAPTEKKQTVYFVDSVNAHTSRKDAPLFAHAVKGVAGSEDYIENAPLPGQYLAKVALSSPDGALVRKVFIDKCFDTISFGYSNSYPQKPSTPYVEIKDGWFFDNGTNQWYEKLEDIPAYIPTEPPTAIATEKPTVKPTVKPEPTQTVRPTTSVSDEEVYIVADGVTYAVNKGDVIEYSYYLSVDSSLKISSLNVHMSYDTEGLDFVPYVDEYGDEDVNAHFPRIYGGVVHNFGIDGKVYYNYSSVSGVRLVNDALVFTGVFKVTADKGVYNIDSRLITLADADMNKIVHEGKVVKDVFTDRADLSYTVVAEPSEEVLSTEIEPQEPVEEPTDAPYMPVVPGAPQQAPTEPENGLEGALPEYEIGDVNRDGKINVFDATAVQRNSAYYIELTDAQDELADANYDGSVNIFDATEIQRYIAGYITEFDKIN